MAEYIELIDKYRVCRSADSDLPTSYTWVDNTGEIVRCGECKYTHRVDEHEIWCTGRGSPCQLVAPDGFCDKGKREQGCDEFHAIPYTSDWAIQNGYE